MTEIPALLVLETGESYVGVACGEPGQVTGEVVFNTSMSGYQEILTDPSYAGQLITMTYPHIGNYGVNLEDMESGGAQAAGFIVRDLTRRPSNHRSRMSLPHYLKRAKVTAITGIDTRALTRRIREGGAVMGIIAHDVSEKDVPELLARLRLAPRYDEQDYVREVTVKSPTRVTAVPVDQASVGLAFRPLDETDAAVPENRLVVMDFGIKYSILRHLLKQGFELTLVPSWTGSEAIISLSPCAVFLSNGPGDPSRLGEIVSEIRSLAGQVPLFGICLGHQLLALALGGRTFKLKYGHRGANQPVRDLATGRIDITSQNHGYAVSTDDLPSQVEVTAQNLNDGTVEALSHRTLPISSVQYHPEAGPGPHDAVVVFSEFASSLKQA